MSEPYPAAMQATHASALASLLLTQELISYLAVRDPEGMRAFAYRITAQLKLPDEPLDVPAGMLPPSPEVEAVFRGAYAQMRATIARALGAT